MNVWAQRLDAAAALAFGDEPGRARFAPLLAEWDEAVGRVREDDTQRELLQAVRSDWALCDAVDEHGQSWLRRLLAGELGGVRPAELGALRRTHVGLFEVYPGRVNWLRDLRGGLCVPLLGTLSIPAEPEGPAAIWEARVAIEGGVAHLCRAPLPYPMSLRDAFVRRCRARFSRGGEPLPWATLRRGWLQFSRARRADPRVVFRF